MSIISMFFMESLFTLAELTTALPYFRFLTSLVSYNLNFFVILLLIFLYSFIYCLPLIVIYFVYIISKKTKFISKFESIMNKISSYVLPFVFMLLR